MGLPLFASKCSEIHVRNSCIYFAVTENKGPCLVDVLAGLFLCVCMCINILMCVCLCVYMYIYIIQK
jgi:hypothetical protein